MSIRIGSVGLGRLGYVHARNIAERVPGAELYAICARDEARTAQAAAELGARRVYTDFERMCADSDLDAVVIASPSTLHSGHIRLALDAGKHVFCEKPLDTTVERCVEAEKAVEAHPDKVFMIGFMRRYDISYRQAKQKIDAGEIGRIILIRCCVQDPVAGIEGTIRFGPQSGGIFLDMGVHDIDLCRWFTSGKNVKELWSTGGCYEFEQFRQWNDGDNACCLIRFEDDTMAFLYEGRAAAHGSHVETEIIGTRGTLRIGSVGTDSMLETIDGYGIRRESHPGFLSRWRDAYLAEMTEFVECVRTGRKPDVTVYDGTAAMEIAYRCKQSFEQGGIR